jgi:protein involved in polysaccharide export with SLBB domain
LLALAAARDVVRHGRDAKTLFLAAFMGLLGFAGTAGILLLAEMADDRLKNADDVRRVARLPVLAVAGDFAKMNDAQKKRWAFRAWTSLQGRLSPSVNHGLICGVTSARHGEGRSTWVNLLARTAHQQGFRVLTIATRQSSAFEEAAEVEVNGAADRNSLPESAGNGYAKLDCPRCGLGIEYPEDTAATSFPCPECSELIFIPVEPEVSAHNHQNGAVQKNFLASPDEVTQRLTDPESQPIVHIPLPGWVWNLERRKQWCDALRHWSQIENVVILVELPPACVPETVLLGENLPNLVWLTAGGQSGAADTREQLETLRHARCKLAGAVLNRAPTSLLQKRFQRWLPCAALLFALNVPILRAAQNDGLQTTVAANQIAETNLSFSTAASAPLAAWQRHLTLGAGDVLNFALYGEPALSQLSVPIGPDGRVSFLEAQDVPAAGLTVDELRAKMDAALAKYRHAPHVIITPVAFNSKKYFLLGSVVHAGAFTLNQPTTILEAIARAGGLETALQQRNVVEIADLQRAFLVRHGRRLPVNFEKLFQRGDLSQNVQLAPGDYLFIPPANLKQVYVVGEVQTPGPAPYTGNLSALGTIAEEGGFTKRAWKQKILVIRGSLTHPRTFVVDANDILSARAAGFRLKPNDIVYVHYRPWVKAEEILDEAATAFVQSAVIVWTGVHAGPLITTPIIR